MPIITWHDDPNDIELYKALRFLEHLANVEDIRPELSLASDMENDVMQYEEAERLIWRSKTEDRPPKYKNGTTQAPKPRVVESKPKDAGKIKRARSRQV